MSSSLFLCSLAVRRGDLIIQIIGILGLDIADFENIPEKKYLQLSYGMALGACC